MLVVRAQDSKFGWQVRSGSEYYGSWDKFAQQAAKDDDDGEDKHGGGAQQRGASDARPKVPGVKGAAAAAEGGEGSAAAATTAGAKGSQLTQRMVELNQNKTPKEKEFLAEQEKVKGNECFRAKEYTQVCAADALGT